MAATALRRMSLPSGMQAPRTGVVHRLRARLARASAAAAPPVDTAH
jgi:hypothetical protein